MLRKLCERPLVGWDVGVGRGIGWCSESVEQLTNRYVRRIAGKTG